MDGWVCDKKNSMRALHHTRYLPGKNSTTTKSRSQEFLLVGLAPLKISKSILIPEILKGRYCLIMQLTRGPGGKFIQTGDAKYQVKHQ